MKVIAVTNPKGGSGKTTTTIHLAATLLEKGFKILVIDLDPKKDATNSCNISDDRLVFSQELTDISNEFNFIFIDTPPTLASPTQEAVEIANSILFPIDTSVYSLNAGKTFLHFLETVFPDPNKRPPIWVLLTSFDPRTKFSRNFREEVQTLFQNQLLETFIHQNVRLKEAASQNQPIALYSPQSKGHRDFLNLTEEFLSKISGGLLPQPTKVSSLPATPSTEGVTAEEFDQLIGDF